MSDPTPDDWISMKEAAAILGLSKRRILVFVEAGRLQSRRIGNQLVLNRPEVQAFAAVPRKAGRPKREP